MLCVVIAVVVVVATSSGLTTIEETTSMKLLWVEQWCDFGGVKSLFRVLSVQCCRYSLPSCWTRTAILSPSSSSCASVLQVDGGINVSPTIIKTLTKDRACATNCHEEEVK